MFDLTGDTAIVTGASRGIGRAIALTLGSAGARIAVCSRPSEALEETVNLLSKSGVVSALPIEVDLSTPEGAEVAISRTTRELGPPTILVNNAASFRVGGLDDVTDADWRSHLELKLLGYVRCIRHVLPHMRAQSYGRIVNVAGNAARLPSPSAVLAGPVNASIVNLTVSVAKAEASRGITANVIHPGATRTDRHLAKVEQLVTTEGLSVETAELRVVEGVPIGRAIEPAEIAAAVWFLVSRDAAAITGQSLAVDGGASAGVTC